MSHVKIVVEFDSREFRVKVLPETTVGQLMYKIRKHLVLRPEEALFLFFRYDGLFRTTEEIHAVSRTLGQIREANQMDVQYVRVLRESTFGALSKMFVKARIEKKKSLFCAICTYSYYGLYHYDTVTVHETLELATSHLLQERCGGHLSLDVGDVPGYTLEPRPVSEAINIEPKV